MQTILNKSQQKRAAFDNLLEKGDVLLSLDPRKEGVIVPGWLRKQPALGLQFGSNMPVPIRDLEITDDDVRATLSFNRAPFWCVIPWAAVYAISLDDGRGIAWPDDFPADATEPVQELKKKPGLRVVKNE